MKRWKIAISIAVVAALVVPFWLKTWNPPAPRWVWVELTSARKAKLEQALRSDECVTRRAEPAYDFDCDRMETEIRDGGGHQSRYDALWSLRYIGGNLLLMAAAFGVAFALGMALPAVALRYWTWLRS